MKLAKLSLAAIMAAGVFSVANATPLEDAIKGVDLSGYVRYRLNDSKNAGHKNEFKFEGVFTTPVQEDLSMTIRFNASADSDDNRGTGASDSEVTFNRAFFTYTPSQVKGLTAYAGKMYTGTPLDDTSSTGLKVLYTMPVGLTLAGAYFDDNSLNIVENVWALAGIYSSEMVSGRVWYINAEGNDNLAILTGKNDNDVKFLFTEVSGGIDMVKGKLQYATADASWLNDNAKTFRAEVDGSYENFGVRVGYIKNDNKSGDVRIDGSANGDNDLIYGGWQTDFNQDHGKYYFVGANAKFDKIGVALEYVDSSIKDATGASINEKDELYATASYQFTKKLSTSVKYSKVNTVDNTDPDYFRFEAKYSF